MSADAVVQLGGFGPNADLVQNVDPSHLAARVSLRPLEHAPVGGPVGGHYRMIFGFSNTAAKPAGGSDVVSLRWLDPRFLFVLRSLKVAVVTTTTYTATLLQDLALFKASGFSVAASSGTQILPIAGAAQRLRLGNMNPTLIGAGGGLLWVSSGDALTVGTRTLDTQGCGYGAFLNPITTPNEPKELTLFDVAPGNHPMVLGTNEGFVIQTPIGNGQVAGVSKFTFTMDWSEVPAF